MAGVDNFCALFVLVAVVLRKRHWACFYEVRTSNLRIDGYVGEVIADAVGLMNYVDVKLDIKSIQCCKIQFC